MSLNTKLSYSAVMPAAKAPLRIDTPVSMLSMSQRWASWAARSVSYLTTIISNEVILVRLVVAVGSLFCIMMGLDGINKYYYREVAFVESFFGILLVILSFTLMGKTYIRQLGNSFIFILDFFNIVLIVTSQFEDKISYEYIIYFFVSSLFFNNRKSLLYCVYFNIALVLIAGLFSSANCTSVSEFYMAFSSGIMALVVLMLRRFKTENLLKESEVKYRLLAENAADIICTHCPDGNFEFVSPAIVTLTGYTPEELSKILPQSLIHIEDLRNFAINAFRTDPNNPEKSNSFQYRLRKKDGTYIWLESVIRPLPNSDGQSKARFLSHTRSFQRHQEYLDQIKLSSNELKSSYKDLEMFAYISSHDMQEPLRMISNYMQLLKRKYKPVLDEEAMEYIDYAVKGASNLQALIKDLLSYSTLNKKEINVAEVDMEMLFDDVLTGLQMLINDRNVKIFMDEPLIPVMGDKNALMQLIQNLIQNGIKYNVSEQPIIRISCKDSYDAVTYTITDNGIGIDDKYLKQIFEPFHRLHNKYNFPGTGLGLSICKKIVDRHHGTMWVKSELEKGSQFHFKIPKAYLAPQFTVRHATIAQA